MSERLTRLRKVGRVGRVGRRGRTKALKSLAISPRGPVLLDTTPPEVAYWMQSVSRNRAMRAYRLKKRGIRGSLPELLAYDWLEGRNREFDFQSSIMGGRLALGGAVADFIIFDLDPEGLVVWRIQGDYWHATPERERKDLAQRIRLLSQRFMNRPVTQVVDLWESAIYWRAPQVFESAELGVEIGRAAEPVGGTI